MCKDYSEAGWSLMRKVAWLQVLIPAFCDSLPHLQRQKLQCLLSCLIRYLSTLRSFVKIHYCTAAHTFFAISTDSAFVGPSLRLNHCYLCSSWCQPQALRYLILLSRRAFDSLLNFIYSVFLISRRESLKKYTFLNVEILPAIKVMLLETF